MHRVDVESGPTHMGRHCSPALRSGESAQERLSAHTRALAGCQPIRSDSLLEPTRYRHMGARIHELDDHPVTNSEGNQTQYKGMTLSNG